MQGTTMMNASNLYEKVKMRERTYLVDRLSNTSMSTTVRTNYRRHRSGWRRPGTLEPQIRKPHATCTEPTQVGTGGRLWRAVLNSSGSKALDPAGRGSRARRGRIWGTTWSRRSARGFRCVEGSLAPVSKVAQLCGTTRRQPKEVRCWKKYPSN